MPGLLIRDISPELYGQLKTEAARHHRSLGQEALSILEQALSCSPPSGVIPTPVQGRFPVTQAFLDEARHEGRE